MLVLRRVLLALAVTALLCSAAAVTGYAVSGRHDRGVPGADPSVAPPAPVSTEPAVVPAVQPSTSPTPTPTPTPAAPQTPTPTSAPPQTPGPRLLGPGDHGPQVRALQARLKQIAWFYGNVTDSYGPQTRAAVEGFQTKRGIPVTGDVDRRTLDRLAAMTHQPTDDELHNVVRLNGNTPGPLDARCQVGRVICIDKSSRTLRWVVDGQVLKTLDVRFGAEWTPTREGVFSVQSKDRDHVSRLFGSPMPYAMFFSRGQAVHYSSDFAARGYAGASHGCVNVRDEAGVAWLFDHVQVGDQVVVYWS